MAEPPGLPRWLRRLCGRHWFGGRGLTRAEVLVVERFTLGCAAVGVTVSFFVPPPAQLALTRLAMLPLFCCYLVALNIRLLDRYQLWPDQANAPAVRPRTWRSILLEYLFLLGTGLAGIVAILWAFS